jgi:hypothetical protein
MDWNQIPEEKRSRLISLLGQMALKQIKIRGGDDFPIACQRIFFASNHFTSPINDFMDRRLIVHQLLFRWHLLVNLIEKGASSYFLA